MAESRSPEKSAAGKTVIWESSISVGPGLDAHGGRGRAAGRPDGRHVGGDDRAGLRTLPQPVLPGSPGTA